MSMIKIGQLFVGLVNRLGSFFGLPFLFVVADNAVRMRCADLGAICRFYLSPSGTRRNAESAIAMQKVMLHGMQSYRLFARG